MWHKGVTCLGGCPGCTPVCAGVPQSYSIKAELDGATILITGATGYIGSVVLEQLLRTTNCAAVYLLLRPKGKAPVQARAEALLKGALFHKVRCCCAARDIKVNTCSVWMH
jgi:fatty acyl-CoA reductase